MEKKINQNKWDETDNLAFWKKKIQIEKEK